MELQEIIALIGRKSSEVSLFVFNKFSETIGTDPTSFSVQILTLIILGFAFLLALKISQKAIKIILLILGKSLIN